MKYYYSIAKNRTTEIKVKRSRFIVNLHYAKTILEAKKIISQISEEHKTANHNCWAYVVGEKGETFHSSDAGEPSGTAGIPILNILKKYGMTNIVAIVTRHFGGVKLGIRGLINAYGEVVETAIEKYPLKKLVKLKFYQIKTGYDFAEQLKYQVEQFDAKIKNIEYATQVTMKISIEKHIKTELENYLIELEKAGKLEILTINKTN